MRMTFPRAVKLFFSSHILIPFLLASTAIAVLGNAAWQVIFNLSGSTTLSAAAIAVVTFALIIGVAQRLEKWLTRAAKVIGHDKREPAPHRGLILLYSKDQTCRTAIRHHRSALKCCWIICDTKFLDEANALRQEFPDICEPEPIVVNDVWNPDEFQMCVDRIYRNLPDSWSAEDVIADCTGMTKPATIGMVLACLDGERHLQYTPVHRDEKRDYQPIEIVLNPAPRLEREAPAAAPERGK